MKKYHIILILILLVNLNPYLHVNTEHSESWIYSPTLQSNLKAELDEQELGPEYKIRVSGFIYSLIKTAPRTTLLILILYMIVGTQCLIEKRRNKANQGMDPTR